MMTEDAPGLGEVLSHFALDVPWIAAMAAASLLYVLAFRRAREQQTRSRHPRAKLVAFQAGIVALFVAVLSPLEHYGNQVLWVNFLDFLVLTMVAPPLLLLGSPLTLAFRASGPAWRARLRSFYRCRCLRYLSFPVVSGLLFAVVTYVWQFSGLLRWAAEEPFARDFQQVTLLLVSLLFWMPALAADPMRWRLPYPLRGLYVLTEMVHKSFFAGMFLTASRPFHPVFAANAPAWAPEAMTDQRYAIFILWFGGNIIFIGMLVYIIAKWLAYEQRNQLRVDHRLALARAAAERRQAALAAVFEKTV
jgi:putative copper resistance protein D